MDLFTIGITLLVVFMLVLVVRILTSRAGGESNRFDQPPYDGTSHPEHPIHHIHPINPTDAGPTHQESGHVGSRDMGSDHHSSGNAGDSGSNFSGGGQGDAP